MRGLISLAFAMLSAQMYPTLKYALGHGQACMQLAIGGETRPVPRDVGRRLTLNETKTKLKDTGTEHFEAPARAL